MRIVRDRRDARWLPSRFHFALFRLYAYVRLRAAKPEPAPGLILSIDRDQSAAENFLTTICIVFVAGCDFAAWFERSMSTPLAYAAGILAAVLAIQALVTGGGALITVVVRTGVRTAANLISVLLMVLMITAGAAVAASDSSARYIAGGFLVLVAMNAAAAVATFLLRNRIAEQERRLGVEH